MSASVTKHKLVTITYLIKGEDGEIIEQNDVPVSYVHGVGSELLPALEVALDGHQVADIVKVSLSPKDAFGERDPALTFSDKTENVPEEFRHVGAQVQFQNEQGDTKTFSVSQVDGDKLTLDGNHPFAGRTIKIEATIHDIRDASKQEIANKAPAQPYEIDIMDSATGAPH